MSSEEQDEILKLISNKPVEKFNKNEIGETKLQFAQGGQGWMPNPNVKKVDRAPKGSSMVKGQPKVAMQPQKKQTNLPNN